MLVPPAIERKRRMREAEGERDRGRLRGGKRKPRDDGSRRFESFRYRGTIDSALSTLSRRNNSLSCMKAEEGHYWRRLRGHYLSTEKITIPSMLSRNNAVFPVRERRAYRVKSSRGLKRRLSSTFCMVTTLKAG